MKEYYEQVNVPKAPEEPDERIDKMTGMPYDVQAGEAFMDEEDRFGFAAGGLVTLIKRLVRGVDEVVNDARPTTRIDIDEDVTDTLREFRSQEPKNFVDPESSSFSTSKVKVDDEGNFIKYLREEEGMELEDFRYYDDQEDIIDRFKMFSPENETAKVSVLREPDERYFVAKKEIDSKIAKELDDELTRIPEEDVNFVQRYFNDIPKRTNKPTPPTASSKEDFLKGSEEQGSQFNASFFSNIKYENPLSARIPRELGLHVGTKGHAETIQIRGAYPRGEELIEKAGVQQYIKEGLDEDSAKVAVNTKGVHDEIFDSKIKELNDFVPVGVKSVIQEGFINVKKPLVLDTDMINWNPAKFLGGADPTGNLKLKEQAQTFVDALNTQVKMDDAQFTKIVDTAALEINSFIRKKDMNSGKLLNSAYDHNINIITRKMLEDLGFDSIKYTNMGELTRVSERQAGGNSYILFRDNQFATDFVPAPRQAADDSGVQFTSAEYNEAFKKFDEIDDVKEWQNSVKAFVKSSREINPDIKTPELEESAKDLLAGKIDRSQHLKNIDNFKPVRPFTELPREPSDKSLIFSHDDSTRYRGNFIQVDDESIFNKTFVHEKGSDNLNILPNTEFKINKGSLSVGDKYRGRLQIPSYTTYDSWVIAGKGGSDKGTTYAKALWYEGKDGVPVKLSANQNQGEKIATGAAGKIGYATVNGWIKSIDVDEIRREADRLIDSGNWTVGEAREARDWTQSGFDPRRQTKFYVRDIKDQHVPILQGDEVIQIGPLVLVKNAVLDKGYQGLATGGRVLRSLGRTRKQDGGLIQKFINAIKNRKASDEENKEMFKDGAKDFRWGETRNKKYYVNHDKFKTVNPGSDYENEILFGESLHSLKEIAPERYEKIYNSAINDPDMKRRLKEAQVFEKEQHRDFNEYVRNTRLDQIIGGYLTGSPLSNIPTMRQEGWNRDSPIYGSGKFKNELESLAKDLGMNRKENPFYKKMRYELD